MKVIIIIIIIISEHVIDYLLWLFKKDVCDWKVERSRFLLNLLNTSFYKYWVS